MGTPAPQDQVFRAGPKRAPAEVHPGLHRRRFEHKFTCNREIEFLDLLSGLVNYRLISIAMMIGTMIITGSSIIDFLLTFSALIVSSLSFNLIK